MSKEIKEAVAQGNFLHFSGKGPNKAVLSRRPLKMVLALCSGPFVEPSRIARVSGSEEWLVRAAAARNKGTPPNIISKLAKDAHPLVRALALQTQSSKPVTKSKRNVSVRFNRQRVWNEIRTHFQYADRPVHFFLLQDARTPRTISSRILELQVAGIKNLGWRDRLDLASSALTELPSQYREAPGVLLKALAKDKNSEVKQYVAKNPNTPVTSLEALAQDEKYDVRRSVAENPNTPVALLEALAKDENEYVWRGVFENPNTPLPAPALKEKEVKVLLGDDAITGLPDTSILDWIKLLSSFQLADNKSLTKASRSKQWLVRLAAALHPDATKGILDLLINDADEDVAAVATEKLSAMLDS